MPCNPDHNGECLVCDHWLSDCPFLKFKEWNSAWQNIKTSKLQNTF
jgi:hypothetical protein